MKHGKWMIVGCLALMSTGLVDASPQKRKAVVRRSIPKQTAFNPSVYAASVADIDCLNIAEQYKALVPFERVARSIVAKDTGAALVKDEFETTSTFQSRATTTYRSWLGGTDKVVFAQTLDPYKLKYDADTSSMQIEGAFSRDYYSNSQTSRSELSDFMTEIFRDTKDGRSYTAGNAYGAVVDVQTASTNRAAMLFKLNGRYESNVGQLGSAKYEIAMAPDVARAFKASAVMLIVGTAAPIFVSRSFDIRRPTISDPERRTTISFGFHVIPQCIVFAYSGGEVARVKGLAGLSPTS